MQTKTYRPLPVLVAAAAVMALAAQLAGQARSSIGMSSPGQMRDVGVGNSNWLRTNAGIGSLNRATGGDSGVLSSSLTPGGFNIRPRSTDAPAGGAAGEITPSGGRSGYGPLKAPTVQDMGLSNDFTAAVLGNRDASGLAQIYLEAVNSTLSHSAMDRTETISSLIPNEPSQYGTLLADGERLFRTNDFEGAFNRFQMANYIGGSDPESLLSMAHASFAYSRYSYARPAYYLRRVLTVLPELPLLPLRPRAFYADGSKFVEHEIRLEEYLQGNPNDAEGNLVLAYIRWFSDRPDAPQQAKAALERGLAATRPEPATIEAIETFWNGMVATGRVSGRLTPRPADITSRPATSQPASRPAGG